MIVIIQSGSTKLNSVSAMFLIILPSSVHEVLLAPWIPGMDRHMMREIVRTVNETEVPDGEQLSDHVYWYIRSEDRIEIAK